jgi:chromosome segregation ATPase
LQGIKGKLNIQKIQGVSTEIKDFFRSCKEVKAFCIIIEINTYRIFVRLNDFSMSEARKVFTSFLSFMTYSQSGFYISHETEDTIEYQMAQLKDIDLYEKKQQSVVALSMAQQDQSKTMQDDLSKYSFQFDAQGKLINGNQRLLELQNSINEMGGDTEEAKKSKQDAIKWLEDLSKKVKEYDTLTEDTIPKTINDYYELANSIKKVRDEMQKANEEKLGNLRDELAEDYLKDQQDKVDDLKKKAEEAKEDAKQALEDEKQSKLDEWDEKIKEKQAELDALNDDSADNETKLKKLQAELALWKKDNSTEAQKKV